MSPKRRLGCDRRAAWSTSLLADSLARLASGGLRMSRLPRVAVGTITAEADATALVWGLTAALEACGQHVQMFRPGPVLPRWTVPPSSAAGRPATWTVG